MPIQLPTRARSALLLLLGALLSPRYGLAAPTPDASVPAGATVARPVDGGAQSQTAGSRPGAVAEAILRCDGCTPGELHRATKAADPGKPSIVSIRELNKALKDGQLAPELQSRSKQIIERQKAAQSTVRHQILDSPARTIRNYLRNNPCRASGMVGPPDFGLLATGVHQVRLGVRWPS